ncbi:MAG: hypothetical protein A2X49_14835 [Lentisphaerae bacterium GWF2_52_8]|nr:MAG: hypothetical protein A2X49_14835 [Lentisphaerae bacterium GWF2_52_8]
MNSATDVLAGFYAEARGLFSALQKNALGDVASRHSQMERIINALAEWNPKDQVFAALAGEIIPLLFTVDVPTGYALFHRREIIEKVWAIYGSAAPTIAKSADVPRLVSRRKKEPFKIACISSIFSDFIAPAQAMVNFATALDKADFSPVFISTNQFFTHEKRIGENGLGDWNIGLGTELARAEIPVLTIPGQESISSLSSKLIGLCAEQEIDIAVSNASVFGFPDACLAISGATVSFFDLHQGFPLYADGIDAILHFNSSTRAAQLGPWEERGGRVLDYCFGVEILTLPDKHPAPNGTVYLITVSNHLDSRMDGPFCSIVSRLLMEFPQLHYQFVGACDETLVRSKFPSELAERLEFSGAVRDRALLTAYLMNSDIYLNEFPVGGGRSVLEAMAASLPVVTMRSGDLHVESLGADFVGEDSIIGLEPEKYYGLVKALVLSPSLRRSMGNRMRMRAENLFDMRKNYRELSERILNIHCAKL